MAKKGPTRQEAMEERRRRREEVEALARAKKKKQTTWTVCGIIGTVLLLALVVVLVMQPWVSIKKHHVEITVKDYGVIKLELDPTYAPITVDNFLSLAKSGFYDGLTFHRIVKDFMIQGGDPDHSGSGGSGKNIKGEFEANGVTNPLSHKRGVISMARSDPYDSASSQFFIVQKYSPHLDGQYAAFGVVTEGMEVVDAIVADAKPTDNNGTIKYEEQPVIESVRIID